MCDLWKWYWGLVGFCVVSYDDEGDVGGCVFVELVRYVIGD